LLNASCLSRHETFVTDVNREYEKREFGGIFWRILGGNRCLWG
jgi:hypothetical protein